MRTITVQGTAEKTVRPDTLRFEFTLNGRNREYATAALESGRKANLLLSALEKTQIAEKPVMSDFTVTAENEFQAGNGKAVFKGYLVQQRAVLEIPLDMETAGRIFDALATAKVDAEMNLSFLLKKRGAVEEELLRDAVASGKRSAERIADASGVRLGRITEVRYNGGNDGCRPMVRARALNAAAASDAFNIAPEDITLSDGVTMVWEIL